MGRAMLYLAIVSAEMQLDLARERTLAGLERVRATGKHLGRCKGGQPEAGRGDTEPAPALQPLVEPHRRDNRVALQQYPPGLHLRPGRVSADCLRGMTTGVSRARVVPGGCRLLRKQTTRITVFTRMVRGPNQELADGCTPVPKM